MKRIYDDPNHRHYGPARRLWMMLHQLDMEAAADMAVADAKRSGRWDHALRQMLDAGVPEKFASRTILYLTLKFLEGDM